MKVTNGIMYGLIFFGSYLFSLSIIAGYLDGNILRGIIFGIGLAISASIILLIIDIILNKLNP